MKRYATLACAGLALAGAPAAAAQSMTVAQFLAKAKALQAQGMAAMFSPDAGLLKQEMQAVAAAYRADHSAARKTGRQPHSCPPPQGQAKMSSKELLAALERIPPAQRNVSMKTAFYAPMKRRFPCR